MWLHLMIFSETQCIPACRLLKYAFLAQAPLFPSCYSYPCGRLIYCPLCTLRWRISGCESVGECVKSAGAHSLARGSWVPSASRGTAKGEGVSGRPLPLRSHTRANAAQTTPAGRSPPALHTRQSDLRVGSKSGAKNTPACCLVLRSD
jgi:hypothetical protein